MIVDGYANVCFMASWPYGVLGMSVIAMLL